MKGLIVFACLLVVVNCVAKFRNGECINHDPWNRIMMETNGDEIQSSKELLNQLEVHLANISKQIVAIELKQDKVEKAELVRQIAVAKGLDTRLRAIKCEYIDDNRNDPYYENKFKQQYDAIADRTAILRVQLNSLTVRVNSIGA